MCHQQNVLQHNGAIQVTKAFKPNCYFTRLDQYIQTIKKALWCKMCNEYPVTHPLTEPGFPLDHGTTEAS